uniref:oligopeptidase A n=1 Tax=Geotrypetes seraphini TaxID=260995 RepID=A0A6P8SL41_GEOSA|nr:probable cytosolic oligopeptidase A [Geotrypetes seraphini]
MFVSSDCTSNVTSIRVTSGMILRQRCVQHVIFLIIWKWISCPYKSKLFHSAEAIALSELNPLLDTSSLPHFSTIVSAHVVPGITKASEDLLKALKEYEKHLQETGSLPRTWESVEEPLEVLQVPFFYSWQIVNHLQNVKNSIELRKVFQQVQPIFVNITTCLDQSLITYNAFKELNKTSHNLDVPQQRILQSYLLSAHHGGADLQPQEQSKLNVINLKLANLTTKFRNNVLDSTKNFSIMLTDEESVKGLPELTRSLLVTNAVTETNQSTNPNKGPWKVTLDSQCYGSIMKHSQNRQLRKDLFHAHMTRAGSGDLNNKVLLEEIRQLRQEKAKILGYETYAHLSLSSKMVQQVDTVWNFLNFLRNKSYPAVQAELQSLQDFAQQHGHEGNLENWDIAFWMERQYESLFSLNDDELRYYFPLDTVLSGLFKLCSDLFGITILERNEGIEVWDPAVRFFKVFDENELLLASFYLDPFSRPQEKNSGAWMQDFITKSKLLHHTPVAFVICNQIPPVGSSPSTMSFGEISTLFHEFGHALQHMLTTVPYAGASGINNIEWDAIEMASQFMENWLFDWDTITAISGHYKTQKTLPQNMFQELLQAQYYFRASSMLYQLYLAALDMELHTSLDPWSQVKERVADKFTVLKPLVEDCIPCTFTHIFGENAYAAGYYSYKWAEMMAQDAFEAFTEVGLQNRDLVIKIGRTYRDTVLSLGGGTSPQEVFRLFRGRDPSPDALLRSYGLQ